MPVPIMARPDTLMTVRTSAKSTLMRPGNGDKVGNTRTARCSTSSAHFSISLSFAFLGAMVSSRLFGMYRSGRPRSRGARRCPVRGAGAFRAPKQERFGHDAHRQGSQLAGGLCHDGEAAPVPDSPMPAVTKTMSASPMAFRIAPMLLRRQTGLR